MKSAADKYVKLAGLEELMQNDSGIKILVKSGPSDSQIKELLMFIEVVIAPIKRF
jgi:hypothetical protein